MAQFNEQDARAILAALELSSAESRDQAAWSNQVGDTKNATVWNRHADHMDSLAQRMETVLWQFRHMDSDSMLDALAALAGVEVEA
jgi:hypothetical protein